jgi:hypothetical protein
MAGALHRSHSIAGLATCPISIARSSVSTSHPLPKVEKRTGARSGPTPCRSHISSEPFFAASLLRVMSDDSRLPLPGPVGPRLTTYRCTAGERSNYKSLRFFPENFQNVRLPKMSSSRLSNGKDLSHMVAQQLTKALGVAWEHAPLIPNSCHW